MNSHLAYLNAVAVAALPHWWEKIDNDPKWQEYSFVGLSAAYGLIALVALVQLVRICSSIFIDIITVGGVFSAPAFRLVGDHQRDTPV